MSYNKNLNIQVEDKNIFCKCIIVDANTEHSFSTSNMIHLTMLIESTSYIAEQFKEKYLKENNYHVFQCDKVNYLQQELQKLINMSLDKESYNKFYKTLLHVLEIKHNDDVIYDERIKKVFKILHECDCSEPSVQRLSNQVFLSNSRLAHLFKKQTGIPLKSYIVLHKLQKAYIYLFQG